MTVQKSQSMNSQRTDYIPRLLKRPDSSFFLFGPRGVGKSTMLRQVLPEALRLDLLDASLYLELSRDPHRLEAIIGRRPKNPDHLS
jgi:predicted AAA+ superfamily ATPase